MKPIIKLSIILCLFAIAWACTKPEEQTPVTSPTPNNTTKSSAKDIAKFSFAALSPAVDATIDGTAKTISATVPAATDVTKLVPTITLSDKATVSPATGVAQDFSKEVSYTVTAEDASTVVYKVNLKKEAISNTGGIVNSENVLYMIKTSYDFVVPASGNNSAYLGSTYRIVAINPNTGSELAVFANNDKGFFPFPTHFVNASLLVGGYYPDNQTKNKNELLDATNGKLKTAYNLSYPINTNSIVDNNTLFIKNPQNNNFHTISITTGTEKLLKTNIGGRPVSVNGLLFTVNSQLNEFKGIYCHDANTFEKKWSKNDTYVADLNPVVSDETIFYVSSANSVGLPSNNKIIALDLKSGKKNWEFQVENLKTIDSSPTVADGILYFQSASQVFAINAKTGEKKWNKTISKTTNNYESYSGVTVGNGLVFIPTNEQTIIALDATNGEQKWISSKSITDIKQIVFVDGVIYTGKSAYNATTGTLKWELKGSTPPFNSPTNDLTKYYDYSSTYSFVLLIKNKTYYPSASGMQQ